MANKVVQMNGSNFYPTSIERTEEKIGQEFTMANGTRRFFWRATKNTWVLTWEGLHESSLAAIRAIYNLGTSFGYVDEFGTTYTVICTTEPYTTQLEANRISMNGTFYYSSVSITLKEV
jgi:hypothetical protein